jgi:hypothetical protein
VKSHTRHIITITCLMFGANALASGYKGEAPPLSPVTIPQLKGGFDISISALYMTPSSSNLTYLGVSRVQTGTDISSHDYDLTYDITPDYNWGFILDLGYVFPNTANDVRFDWMAFHSNYSEKHKVVGQDGVSTNVVFFPTSSELLLIETDYAKALGTINYKLDALDLTFGQYLNIYKRLQTRVFTGLRYARFDSNMQTTYIANWDTSGSTPVAGAFSGNINSSFNGLGPMIGTRADFDLGKGLGLTGSFDIALLAGQLGLSANQVIHENTAGIPAVIRNALNWGTQKIIAPAFDAKFGINYQYQFNNGTQLIGELGYQVSQYLDVIEQMDRDFTLPPIFGKSLDGITTNPNFSTDVTNFDLRGPYLTLRVKV